MPDNSTWNFFPIFSPNGVRLNALDDMILHRETDKKIEFLYALPIDITHQQKIVDLLEEKTMQAEISIPYIFAESEIKKDGDGLYLSYTIRYNQTEISPYGTPKTINSLVQIYLSSTNQSHVKVIFKKENLPQQLTYSAGNHEPKDSLEVQESLRFVIRYLSHNKNLRPSIKFSSSDLGI